MDNSIIQKYLRGKASDEEKEQLFNWLDESASNKEEYIEIKKLWALTSREKNVEGKTWSDIKPSESKPAKTKILQHWLARAAVFLLLLSCGAIGGRIISKIVETPIYSQMYTVISPAGQMTNIELPDGTLVMLNSGTKIQYSSDFSKGDRQVYLEGEAFFDVQKDVDHPFTVKSDFLGVRVYGTSFNIQAYPDDKKFTATLVEGSIGLLDKNGEELEKLVPGEKAYFEDSESTLQIMKVDTNMYTSWKEGLVTFRDEKMKDIAKQIERWYNVEIIIQKEGLGEERYFGSILKNKPIDQILEVFKLTISLEYEIIPRADKPTLIYWK
ncbi:FecR domain-containing protein [uncultured Draconibacterium sp.]|uniref:FecR family protein n=1 Tax=uncultured Draconibacterium sp. TaxID=1573823 RepID=UPI0029C7594F|nr:FecR domain-containing protein [uncultured Draconibacterium sp.]